MRKTQPSLAKFAEPIHNRDKGICWVCDRFISLEEMHVGHIVDRCAGGLDELDNLAPMCPECNVIHKPVHETREKAEEWRRARMNDIDPYIYDARQAGALDKYKAFLLAFADMLEYDPEFAKARGLEDLDINAAREGVRKIQ